MSTPSETGTQLHQRPGCLPRLGRWAPWVALAGVLTWQGWNGITRSALEKVMPDINTATATSQENRTQILDEQKRREGELGEEKRAFAEKITEKKETVLADIDVWERDQIARVDQTVSERQETIRQEAQKRKDVITSWYNALYKGENTSTVLETAIQTNFPDADQATLLAEPWFQQLKTFQDTEWAPFFSNTTFSASWEKDTDGVGLEQVQSHIESLRRALTNTRDDSTKAVDSHYNPQIEAITTTSILAEIQASATAQRDAAENTARTELDADAQEAGFATKEVTIRTEIEAALNAEDLRRQTEIGVLPQLTADALLPEGWTNVPMSNAIPECLDQTATDIERCMDHGKTVAACGTPNARTRIEVNCQDGEMLGLALYACDQSGLRREVGTRARTTVQQAPNTPSTKKLCDKVDGVWVADVR